ncbi:MAG: hypothetical protein IJI35_15315 [Kiritimatiellae bacterium]|nr:hypothetical protein [Kiritimatiellia bacterium]
MEKASSGYAGALEGASRMARRELDAVLDKLDLDDPVSCKRALYAAFPAIVRKYGAMAAAAAAESYGRERDAVLGGHYEALMAEPVDEDAMLAKLRYALRYLFGEVDDGDGGE